MSDERATTGGETTAERPERQSSGSVAWTWLILALGLAAGAGALWLTGVVSSGSGEGRAADAGAEAAGPEMTVAQALWLGVVEGLTEYLPVSSTGHLILTQRAMSIESGPAANAYAICIQAGAILAVLGLYAARVRQMTEGLLLGRDEAGRRMAINIIAGFVPAAVIGLLLNDWIKAHLFGLWPIVWAWFVGGVLILGVSWWRRAKGEPPREGLTLEGLTWRMALLIGFAQCVAMWPGTSRSLVTIVGGVLVGLSLPAAVEFSFLLGVVTLGAATCYDAMRHGPVMLEAFGPVNLAVGFVAATVSAVLAVKWMVAYINKHGMAVFGYYRVGLAIVVAALILRGVLGE